MFPSAATSLHRRGGIVFAGLLLAFCTTVAQAEATTLPRLAIVIDDLGNNQKQDQRALNLPGQITASILPLCRYSATEAKAAKTKGWLVIAHLPMQSAEGNALGAGGLTAQMDKTEIQQQLSQDLDSLPGVNGASNHMGSQLTADRQAMRWVMEGLKTRPSMFFLDSRTSINTVAAVSARLAGIPTLERDVFFDHDRSPLNIEKQFDRMLQIARKNGSAIAIGHPYPETMAVLEKRIPQLAGQGYQLVRLTTLLPTANKAQ